MQLSKNPGLVGSPSTAHRVMCFVQMKDPYDNERKQLILRKSYNGLWGLCGGSIDPEDHSLHDGVLRELHEETNIDLNDLKLLTRPGSEETAKVPFKYGQAIRTVSFFDAGYLKPTWSLNITIVDNPEFPRPEHMEYRWVARKEEIKNLPFVSDEVKARLMAKLK